MKKVYYIGRDESSDIVLQDDSNIISRTHAILIVGRRGRYTISDQSKNGTYVNGIRIASGVEVPVSRTDIISFAHLIELDWSLIPNTRKRGRIIVLSIISGLILIGVLGWGILNYFKEERPTPTRISTMVENHSDSLRTKADTLKPIVAPIKEKRLVGNDTPKVLEAPTSQQVPVKKNIEETTEAKNINISEDSVKTKKNINAIF